MSKQCTYFSKRTGRCNYQTILIPDKSQPVEINRVSGSHYINNPSIQVLYPMIPGDYCYYHDKVMKGLINGYRRQDHQT